MNAGGNTTGTQTENTAVHATLAHRYSSAWAEINARIQSRQTVNVFFATITVTASSFILGLVFGPNPLPSGRENALFGISLGLILLAWVFVLWVRHNDAIIGLLGTFCKAIERLDDPDNTRGFPSWHEDRQQLIVKGRQYRKLSDFATILLTFIATVPSFSLAYSFGKNNNWLAVALLMIGFIGVGAAVFTYKNAFLRKKIACMEFKNNDGQWIFSGPEELFEMKQKA